MLDEAFKIVNLWKILLKYHRENTPTTHPFSKNVNEVSYSFPSNIKSTVYSKTC